MKNIVHFGKYYFPDAGGIESVTGSLARGAARKGHAVTVVCFEKTAANRDEQIDGVRVVRAPIAKMVASQPLGLSYLTRCLREARDADVVHLHAPNMLGALGSLLMGKRPRLLVHWHSDVINKGILGKLLRPLETALLKRADSIVATSQVYADESATLRAFSDKITVVPIGIPDATLAAGIDVDPGLPVALEQGIIGRKLILAVGRLVPYKGFDVLIEAAKYLQPGTAVVIVGGGPLRDTLQAAIDAAGLSDTVYLAGRLSDSALHSLFVRASLYCMPSTYRAEAFGVVLLEAMAHGLPIVATDIPGSGVPWVNQHGLTGLNVPVSDPRALADACIRILSSTEEHARYAEGARARFLSEFTEDVSVKRMLSAYNQIIERDKHPAVAGNT
ncbi:MULTISPECIES: glycosyltransferase [unclassified Massilia]|uniref:glycosyltransferase n=1 Tax=unclassified Massilia TaxID=2609279 RepID=UPI00177F4D1C|nr:MULTISPECIES: glycosyltransferase [unclassified Massilia]MBD8528785.1 glycosyltransferase [Massilia sp. CFBP 13647]MBD8673426.1 glycosyltransferase [Massilia sp. CFBP 13721]